MNQNDKLSLNDMFAGGGAVTPSGLHVSEHAFEGLVKAEARKIAKDTKSEPTLFDNFALAQNMMVYGAREKPQGTPTFTNLYDAARKSFVDSILIQARSDQQKMIWQKAMIGANNQIGFKVVHDRHDDPDFEYSKNDKERCAEMSDLLSDPTPDDPYFIDMYPHNIRVHDSLKDFISRMVRSELIIDRKVMYRYKRLDGKGYAAFHWLPGETIRPVHEGLKEWAKRYERDGSVTTYTMANIHKATGIDLTNKVYVQLTSGQIVAAFEKDEISLHISNPSDRVDRYGYGTSRLEISLDVTSTLMYAWNYNQELFKTNYPEAILTVSGDYDKQGLESFKQKIMQEAGGPGSNWRLPVIPGGDKSDFKIESHKLRDSPKDMLFDKMFRMMVAIKCFKYDTMIDTDRGKMRIGEVVSKRLPVKIKSFDRETGEILWADVSDWQSLKSKEWVKLFYPGGKKRRTIEVTKDHELWAGDRMVEAQDLNVGDTLYVEGEDLTADQEQVILGSLLGDGSLRKSRGFCDVPDFTESHSESQRYYVEWKMMALGNLSPKSHDTYVKAKKEGKQKYAAVQMRTKATATLYRFRELCYDKEGVKRSSWEWLSQLKPLGLAVWFMDDGNFTKRTGRKNVRARIALMPGTAEELTLYMRYFAEYYELYPKLSPKKNTRGFTLDFSVRDSAILIDILSPYLSVGEPFSQYHGPRKVWGNVEVAVADGEALVPVPVIGKELLFFERGRPCYDVTVSGTHTLFANGLASSNCAAYGAHPTIINFSTDSESKGGLFGHNPSDEIEFSKEHGLNPSLMDQCQWLTGAIIKPRYDDLRVILVGLDSKDDKHVLDIATSKGAVYKTRNELRMEDGLEPKGDIEDTKNPWNYPNDTAMPQYMQSFQMEQGGEEGEPEEGVDFGAEEGEEALAEMENADGGQEAEEGFLGKAQKETKFLKISLED